MVRGPMVVHVLDKDLLGTHDDLGTVELDLRPLAEREEVDYGEVAIPEPFRGAVAITASFRAVGTKSCRLSAASSVTSGAQGPSASSGRRLSIVKRKPAPALAAPPAAAGARGGGELY